MQSGLMGALSPVPNTHLTIGVLSCSVALAKFLSEPLSLVSGHSSYPPSVDGGGPTEVVKGEPWAQLPVLLSGLVGVVHAEPTFPRGGTGP